MKRSLLLSALLLAVLAGGCAGQPTAPPTAEHFRETLPAYDGKRAFYWEDNLQPATTVHRAEEDGLFVLDPTEGGKRVFHQLAAGYRLNVPADFEVLDMRDARSRSTLGNDDTMLEVFTHRTAANGTQAETALDYANRFTQNHEEFRVSVDETATFKGGKLRFLAWSRRPLAHIDQDRPYYGIVDYVKGDRVLSLQLTSTRPLDSETLHAFARGIAFKTPSADASAPSRFPALRTDLNAETRAFYNDTFGKDAPLTWGLFEPSLKGKSPGKLPALEKRLDHDFKILLYYSELHPTLPPGYIYDTLTTVYKEGAVCELTLQPPRKDPLTTANPVFDILDGKYDAFLRAYAREIAKFGHPVLFRPFNEMNAEWCTYSGLWAGRDPSLYIECYRLIYRIFEEEGALANTLWVWNPNGASYPNYGWNAADCYYPGDAYVDIVGLTGYNTGTYYEGERWRSFEDIYTPLYRNATLQYAHPLMITEFACSSIGGDKAAWVKDMLARLSEKDRIKAAIWWNSADFDTDGNVARPYYIDDNDEVVTDFKSHLNEDQ